MRTCNIGIPLTLTSLKRLVISMAMALMLVTGVSYSQTRKPLTADDLIAMKSAGLDEQTVVKAIQTNGADLDTSALGLVALKKAGISDAVIQAVLAAQAQSQPKSVNASDAVAGADELGIYVSREGALTLIRPETATTKTGGQLSFLKVPFGGKVKGDGLVAGTKSSLQLAPPVQIVIHCPETNPPEAYQLLHFDQKKDHREFVITKVGIGGVSGGAENAIPVSYERIGKGMYRATLPDLKAGEYGFVLGSMVYSFGIVR